MLILKLKNKIVIKIICIISIIILISISTYSIVQNVSFVNDIIFPKRIIYENFKNDEWLTVLTKDELSINDYRYNFTKALQLTNYASNSLNTMYVRIVDENNNILDNIIEIGDGQAIKLNNIKDKTNFKLQVKTKYNENKILVITS